MFPLDLVNDSPHRLLGRTILPFLYGYHPKAAGEDPVVQCAKRGMEVFDQVTDFGAFLVDLVPICKRRSLGPSF